MDKIKKFLLKLTQKERTVLRAVLEDVFVLDLADYDVKPLKGHKGVFRLRKGDIRIIFFKQKHTGIVIDIDYRKDIYKN